VLGDFIAALNRALSLAFTRASALDSLLLGLGFDDMRLYVLDGSSAASVPRRSDDTLYDTL
jgi:hypothetical protein